MATNPWSYWLEEVPNVLYQAMVPSGTPTFSDYWTRQQSRVMNEYERELGKQALSGEPPSMMFSEFLKNYPWQQKWWELSPSQRNVNIGRLAPSLQWRV